MSMSSLRKCGPECITCDCGKGLGKKCKYYKSKVKGYKKSRGD